MAYLVFHCFCIALKEKAAVSCLKPIQRPISSRSLTLCLQNKRLNPTKNCLETILSVVVSVRALLFTVMFFELLRDALERLWCKMETVTEAGDRKSVV